jgi:hypothetical protein
MADVTELIGDHYRETSSKLRDLARQTYFPSVREVLIGIARRCDRMADPADGSPNGRHRRYPYAAPPTAEQRAQDTGRARGSREGSAFAGIADEAQRRACRSRPLHRRRPP